MNTEDDEYTKKEAGWEILRMFGREEEGDDEDDEEDYDTEEDDDDFDGDEELDEAGMDWDEMEKKAAADDKRVRMGGVEVANETPRKRRGGGRERESGRRKRR